MSSQTKSYPFSFEQLPKILDFVCQWIQQHSPSTIQSHVELAVDEIVSNILLHSDAPKDSVITIECEKIDPKGIQIHISDAGKMFNPVEWSPSEDKLLNGKGGHGLRLVKHFVDQILYKRYNDRNCVTLRKLD